MTVAAVSLLCAGFGLWLVQSGYQAAPRWEPPPLWGRVRWLIILWTVERACVYGALALLLLGR